MRICEINKPSASGNRNRENETKTSATPKQPSRPFGLFLSEEIQKLKDKET